MEELRSLRCVRDVSEGRARGQEGSLQSINPVASYHACRNKGGAESIFIGASLSKPHTSGTAFRKCMCMFAAIYRKSVRINIS